MNFLETLHKYKKDGWLMNQTHPTLPLTIWNYSRTTQFENHWDEITVQCRGLVTDDETGEIVARPFKKFWNEEERRHTATPEFSVYEKMDGSLIIIFKYRDEWVVASRGSFTSDFAVKAVEFLNDDINERMATPLNSEYTYLFEIIWKEERIVVDYDFEGLVMLGAINTKTAVEMHYDDLLQYEYGFRIVKRYDGIKDYKLLKAMVKDDAEGFVTCFTNGDKMKTKGENYFRLHYLMTDISTTAIWRILKRGGNIDEILGGVPDEFYDKIKSYVKELRYNYHMVTEYAGKPFDTLIESGNGDLPDRASFAKWTKQFEAPIKHILFRMYDKNDYSEIVWNAIRPEFRKL